jgi:hypothetical protein
MLEAASARAEAEQARIELDQARSQAAKVAGLGRGANRTLGQFERHALDTEARDEVKELGVDINSLE